MKLPLKLSSGVLAGGILIFTFFGFGARLEKQTQAAAQWYWPTYQVGSSGENVWSIQYMLRERGFNITPNGQFDASTANAVKALQAKYHLKETGIVDATTWIRLVVPTSQGDSGAAVTALQRQLKQEEGAASGRQLPTNGIFDSITAQVVKTFQEQNSPRSDGRADLTTWNMLVGGRASSDSNAPFALPANIGPMPDRVARIIRAAQTKLGTIYLWGGACQPNDNNPAVSTAERCDCSELVTFAYKHGGGLNIEGHTHPQLASGPRISMSQIQPGDLLFPHSEHVALYIGRVDGVGENVLIEAPSRNKQVRYVNITENSRWRNAMVVRPRVLSEALERDRQAGF